MNHTEYYGNGVISKEYSKINGVLSGLYTTYYPNGQPSIQTTYLDGKCHGKLVQYTDYNGKIDVEEYYYHGQRVSQYDLFTKYRELLPY